MGTITIIEVLITGVVSRWTNRWKESSGNVLIGCVELGTFCIVQNVTGVDSRESMKDNLPQTEGMGSIKIIEVPITGVEVEVV